jgi:dsDNA-specific endonuclease/ATPase MutS2
MAKLKLDLHDIYNQGKDIKEALGAKMHEAVGKKIKMLEIIPGKGSGQLRRTVIRFLQQGHIKSMYHRIEIDQHNHGRLFVHFKHKQ